ncbi:MAG: hypothetical protein IJ849_11720 [Selenomonadaceae bacterium]|nr:hypothetical protein [Selenomonadaceae bacterium]
MSKNIMTMLLNTRLRLTDCRLRLMMDAWEESKHPRRKDGRFGEGGGAVEENSIIEPEFTVMRTLSAMAKKFYVKVPKPTREEDCYIKEGSTVTGVKVIASGNKIRDVNRLIEENPLPNGHRTKAQDWYKCRGTAEIVNGAKTYKNCEIHWYQCENIGKIEFKIKVWGDEV